MPKENKQSAADTPDEGARKVLQKYFFPHLNKTVEATSLAEATAKVTRRGGKADADNNN